MVERTASSEYRVFIDREMIGKITYQIWLHQYDASFLVITRSSRAASLEVSK